MAVSLFLAEVGLRELEPGHREALWTDVVDLAVEHGAVGFTAKADTADGSQPPVAFSGLSGLGDLAPSRETVERHGAEVVEVNLYSDSGWIAGICDWGDSVAVLLDQDGLDSFRRLLEDYGHAGEVDVLEAVDRPRAPVVTRRGSRDVRWSWIGANLLRFMVLVAVACVVALVAAALLSVAVASILGLMVVAVGAQFAWRGADRDVVDEERR